MSYVQRLTEQGLIKPPRFLPSNVHYETMMGSIAYGVSGDSSDMDIYGFCIPPKSDVFPHLKGEIVGFGRQTQRFDQWQQHHVDVPDHRKVYDFSIYNIVRYFQLLMENNPNMIDSIYTKQECILHITAVGTMVRDSRNIFLHKGAWHKFKGYAYSQLHKMESRNPEGKRIAIVEKYGFDIKFAYHLVRLLDECEQILMLGDIDLHRNKEHLKAIRRGEVSKEDIKKWASEKEKQLEKLYVESKLQHSPPENEIKQLLLQCLEHHYGSLENAIQNLDGPKMAIEEIKQTLNRYNL